MHAPMRACIGTLIPCTCMAAAKYLSPALEMQCTSVICTTLHPKKSRNGQAEVFREAVPGVCVGGWRGAPLPSPRSTDDVFPAVQKCKVSAKPLGSLECHFPQEKPPKGVCVGGGCPPAMSHGSKVMNLFLKLQGIQNSCRCLLIMAVFSKRGETFEKRKGGIIPQFWCVARDHEADKKACLLDDATPT